MVWLERSLLVATILGTINCRSGTDPYGALEMQVEVDPQATTVVGEVLTLRAIATNHGDRSVELGYGCGAGLDFEVEAPTGERRFLLRGLPSLCPLYDSNVLEPAETDTVEYRWTVPGPQGTYRVRAGGRVRAGLAARSPVIEVKVE